MRHVECIHCDKADVTNREGIVGPFRHRVQKIGEAFFVHIMVADDGAPGHFEAVEFTAHHSVSRAASVVGYVSWQKDEAYRPGKYFVDLIHNLRQVEMVLLTGTVMCRSPKCTQLRTPAASGASGWNEGLDANVLMLEAPESLGLVDSCPVLS